MTRRSRGVLVVIGLVAGIAAAEVGLNLWMSPEACVEVQNGGAEPIEDLVVSCGSSRVNVGRVAPGASAQVRVGERGTKTLALKFSQKGNGLKAFELPGFDAAQLVDGGFRQVLRIKTNEVERYVDDAEATTQAGQLVHGLVEDVNKQLEAERRRK